MWNWQTFFEGDNHWIESPRWGKYCHHKSYSRGHIWNHSDILPINRICLKWPFSRTFKKQSDNGTKRWTLSKALGTVWALRRATTETLTTRVSSTDLNTRDQANYHDPSCVLINDKGKKKSIYCIGNSPSYWVYSDRGTSVTDVHKQQHEMKMRLKEEVKRPSK